MKQITKDTVFKPESMWAKLPHPMRFHEATSVATDSKDNVYIFNRGEYPLIIFDKEGNYLSHWGKGEFDRPHGIRIDQNDDLFLIDDISSPNNKAPKHARASSILPETRYIT